MAIKHRILMKFIISALLVFWGVNIFAQDAKDALWLPAIFGDHMVLQQGKDLPVWGRAKSGETVKVTVGDQSGETKATVDGKWMLRLKPMLVTQNATEVNVSSGGEEIIFSDVLIGDVWLCSGQSNMAMGIGNMKDGKQAVAKANHPRLRMFLMPRSVSFEQAEDVKAKWIPHSSPFFIKTL